ncbi:MAG TPA: PfkB family carbohydrate kinase [Solirubrobacteraceae bacterium]|nr:PfkB family carbohydrate kinase [Solirubrobacteraceae bacterium]
MSSGVESKAGSAPILVGGEALYDLVAGEGDGHAEGSLTGHAGGGPFNTARTIGRLRQPVAFLGGLSNDRLGASHARMLAADGVSLDCVVRSDDPTTLALASLDADGVASYGFYTARTAAAGLTVDDALAALPARVAALHVGTLGLVLEPVASAMEAVVQRLAGRAMTVVDLNCRPQAIDDPRTYRARLARVVARVDVVKASEEDLGWLDRDLPPLEAARALLQDGGPTAVLLTRGAEGAVVLTAGAQTPVPPVPAVVVDTIGAGAAFGGGFLAWWISRGLGAADLARHELVVEAARYGAIVAARTVAQAGASPPRLPAAVRGRPLDAADL